MAVSGYSGSNYIYTGNDIPQDSQKTGSRFSNWMVVVGLICGIVPGVLMMIANAFSSPSPTSKAEAQYVDPRNHSQKHKETRFRSGQSNTKPRSKAKAGAQAKSRRATPSPSKVIPGLLKELEAPVTDERRIELTKYAEEVLSWTDSSGTDSQVLKTSVHKLIGHLKNQAKVSKLKRQTALWLQHLEVLKGHKASSAPIGNFEKYIKGMIDTDNSIGEVSVSTPGAQAAGTGYADVGLAILKEIERITGDDKATKIEFKTVVVPNDSKIDDVQAKATINKLLDDALPEQSANSSPEKRPASRSEKGRTTSDRGARRPSPPISRPTSPDTQDANEIVGALFKNKKVNHVLQKTATIDTIREVSKMLDEIKPQVKGAYLRDGARFAKLQRLVKQGLN